jgi:potassium channel subfamily K
MSSPQQSRMKHLTRAAKGRPPPPPSPFQREAEGMSTILKAIIAVGVYLLVGLLSFSLLETELEGIATSATVDALYFAVVTMTTVGYGDLVPKTVGAKLFTCAFVFAGFGLVGVLLSSAANYLVEKQEKILVQKIYLKYMHREHRKAVVIENDDVVAAHWKMLIAGVAVFVHFAAGMFALVWWEGMSFIDGFYLVCVTVTTLGYGDRSFRTQAGRIFAVVWILSSTVCVAQFFLYLAESRTEERQHEIAGWALHRPTTPSDLEAADMDGDGVVRSVLVNFSCQPSPQQSAMMCSPLYSCF